MTSSDATSMSAACSKKALHSIEHGHIEKLIGEKPRWQKSNPGKERAGVASQWSLESQSAVSQVVQDTNTKASATTLGRIPVIDPQPHSPCSVTLKMQNSVTDVAETAVVDHGSHYIAIPIKGHFQKAGQPRWAKLRLRGEAGIQLRNRRRGDNRRWSRVLSKGSCNHRRRMVRIPCNRGS